MNTPSCFPLLRMVALSSLCAGLLRAQPLAPAPVSPPESAPKETAPVVLNPFLVSTAGDRGYLAGSSLAGSRLNTNLGDLAAPTTAFTQQFLEDVGLHNVDDLTEYMVNTRMNTPESNNLYFDADSSGFLIRGLPASTYSVNFFPTTLKLDFYNTERVDQSRGPNSILFGLGNPGGLVNISSNRGVLGRTFGSLDVDVGSQSEFRTALDANVAFIPDKLSLRIDAVRDYGNTWRTREFDHEKRIYGALAYQPMKNTRLDLEFEHGIVQKSKTQPQTIIDGITPWIAAGRPLSTTANAAQSIGVLSAVNRNTIDTTTGILTDTKGQTASVSNTINGTASWLSDFHLVPKNVAMTAGPQFYQDTNYTRGSVFIAHDFTPTLNVELAANAQKFYHNAMAPRGDILQADTDPTLANGAPNPNVGRAFVDEDPVTTDEFDRAENVRLSASYTLDLGPWLGKHSLAGLFEKDWTRTESDQLAPINWTTPESTTLINGANILFFRTYMDLSGPAANLGEGDWRPFIVHPPGSNSTWNDFATTTLKNPTTGYTMGVKWVEDSVPSDNHFTQDSGLAVLQSHFLKDHLITVVGYRQDREDGWYSQTTAALAQQTPYPGFVTGENTVVPSGPAIENNAYNLTYSALLKVTNWFAISYNHSRDSALPDPNALVINSDNSSHVPGPHGTSEDMGFKLLLGNRLNFNATYYQTSTTNSVANSNASIETVFGTIWSALNTAGVSGPNGVNALNVPQKFNRYTFNQTAQGYEFELIANPTDNIRILTNFSDNLVKQTNLGPLSIAYYNKYSPYWLQYGNIVIPGATGQTVAQAVASIQSNINNLYILQSGQQARGQIPYQFNFLPVYEFHTGTLKGVWFGAGLTYRSAPIVDYEVTTNAAGASVRQIYHGSSNTLVNAMLGYKSRYRGRIPWQIQLNVNNVFDETRILPTRKILGRLDSYAVQPPLVFLVSTKISF
jgi:iron complex outermembrane receptor protein